MFRLCFFTSIFAYEKILTLKIIYGNKLICYPRQCNSLCSISCNVCMWNESSFINKATKIEIRVNRIVLVDHYSPHVCLCRFFIFGSPNDTLTLFILSSILFCSIFQTNNSVGHIGRRKLWERCLILCQPWWTGIDRR